MRGEIVRAWRGAPRAFWYVVMAFVALAVVGALLQAVGLPV
jgi:hydrogenase/urease accessory protein HupE